MLRTQRRTEGRCLPPKFFLSSHILHGRHTESQHEVRASLHVPYRHPPRLWHGVTCGFLHARYSVCACIRPLRCSGTRPLPVVRPSFHTGAVGLHLFPPPAVPAVPGHVRMPTEIMVCPRRNRQGCVATKREDTGHQKIQMGAPVVCGRTHGV